jgi:hypothetical protein
MYLPDRDRFAICSHVDERNANIKPSSVLKSLRGVNAKPAACMTRKEGAEVFHCERPPKEGEIRVTAIPEMDRNTADVSMIRWNWVVPRSRASFSSAEGRIGFHTAKDRVKDLAYSKAYHPERECP